MHIEQIQVYRGEIIALVSYGSTQRIMELRERSGKLVWEPLPNPPAFDKVREIEQAREVKLVHETIERGRSPYNPVGVADLQAGGFGR